MIKVGDLLYFEPPISTMDGLACWYMIVTSLRLVRDHAPGGYEASPGASIPVAFGQAYYPATGRWCPHDLSEVEMLSNGIVVIASAS